MAPGAPAKKEKASRAWEALTPPLAEWILQAVSSLGYQETTPVQAASIPLFLGNSDVVVESPTGSGKTLAYLIPLVQKILRAEEPIKRHHITALIVAPTRELAVQIHGVLLALLAFHERSQEALSYLKGDEKRPIFADPVVVPQLCVGGTTKLVTDVSFFVRNSPNVIVGTPGRLCELLASSHCNSTSSFETLVLDEADRLLDLGFKEHLDRILAFIPKQRRTGLFSASISEAVGSLIQLHLRNPRRVTVSVKSLKDGSIIEEKRMPASLQVACLVVPGSHKFPALVQLLEKMEPRPRKTIVFFSTCMAVKYAALALPAILPAGYEVIALHGKLDHSVRERAFRKYLTATSHSILFTTDVASRGLDIPQVDLVVQETPPADTKSFMHRCGRSGRAGARGLAVTFLLPGREEDFIPFMTLRKMPITDLVNPSIRVTPEEAQQCTTKLRSQNLADRDMFQLSVRAFVSWVRAYIEHRASSIFRVADLDFTDLAHQWGLVQLPKMPELRGIDIDRSLGLGIDVDAIAYREKPKEKIRQAELAERRAKFGAGDAVATGDGAAASDQPADGAVKRKKTEAWSEKQDKADERVARRDKKRRKKEAERYAGMNEQERADKQALDAMVAEIRRKNEAAAAAGGDEEGEFEGFGD